MLRTRPPRHVGPTRGDDVQREVRTDPRDLRQIHSVQRVGAETARLCVALGMTVISIDPRPEHEFPGAIHAPFALGDLLRDADLVVATAPHTPETEFMWNMERFRRMKPSAYFINIGRAMLPLSRGLRPAPIRFNEAFSRAVQTYLTGPGSRPGHRILKYLDFLKPRVRLRTSQRRNYVVRNVVPAFAPFCGTECGTNQWAAKSPHRAFDLGSM